ncbi:hypothetical protein AGR6A_pa20048 [Agrobacterium sp. NCPPB 925]|nr:hypothetical protein AGR6A_pa20048 [Agrobacterium sp. NCPPB 925]
MTDCNSRSAAIEIVLFSAAIALSEETPDSTAEPKSASCLELGRDVQLVNSSIGNIRLILITAPLRTRTSSMHFFLGLYSF